MTESTDTGSLDLAELRRENDARAIAWTHGNRPSLSFAMMELAGEVGEACNVAKKIERASNGWAGGSSDLEALADELGDVVICADLAASRAGINLSDAVIAKFNKTSEKHLFPHRLFGLRVKEQHDQMKRLKEENERLRIALEKIAHDAPEAEPDSDYDDTDGAEAYGMRVAHFEHATIARAALKGGGT